MGTPHNKRWTPAGTLRIYTGMDGRSNGVRYVYESRADVKRLNHIYLLGVLYQLNNLPSINDMCRVNVILRERERERIN